MRQMSVNDNSSSCTSTTNKSERCFSIHDERDKWMFIFRFFITNAVNNESEDERIIVNE